MNTSLKVAEAQHTLDRGSMQVDWVLNEIEHSQCMPPSHSSAGRAKVCNWKPVLDHLRSRVRITVAGSCFATLSMRPNRGGHWKFLASITRDQRHSSELRHSNTIIGSYMLISARVGKVQPAIAQLEERRFVIGNRSQTTLGPVFESRWLDIFTT